MSYFIDILSGVRDLFLPDYSKVLFLLKVRFIDTKKNFLI